MHAAGRTGTVDDVVWSWSGYSDDLCAGWLGLPDSDDKLLIILLKYWPTPLDGAEGYVVTLMPVNDASGDMWLPLPDDVIRSIGWRIGDELEVERQGHTLMLRRLATKTKEQWMRPRFCDCIVRLAPFGPR